MALIDYDAELQLHNARLRAAYDIQPDDRVLDIGCGTGRTTREAARLAWDGEALGVDRDAVMIARAQELADREGPPNVRFEVGDVQVYRFQANEFDVAISRFGTMFFADPGAAFRNVGRALRPGGRLVMMVWQARDRNEWAVSIDRALARAMSRPIVDVGPDPFSLGEPAAARRILASAGFTAVMFTDVEVPVYYGRDVDAALDFVSRFGTVSEALRRSDPWVRTSIVADLHATLTAHASDGGVWLESRAWIVTARRGDPSVAARCGAERRGR